MIFPTITIRTQAQLKALFDFIQSGNERILHLIEYTEICFKLDFVSFSSQSLLNIDFYSLKSQPNVLKFKSESNNKNVFTYSPSKNEIIHHAKSGDVTIHLTEQDKLVRPKNEKEQFNAKLALLSLNFENYEYISLGKKLTEQVRDSIRIYNEDILDLQSTLLHFICFGHNDELIDYHKSSSITITIKTLEQLLAIAKLEQLLVIGNVFNKTKKTQVTKLFLERKISFIFDMYQFASTKPTFIEVKEVGHIHFVNEYNQKVYDFIPDYKQIKDFTEPQSEYINLDFGHNSKYQNKELQTSAELCFLKLCGFDISKGYSEKDIEANKHNKNSYFACFGEDKYPLEYAA